MELLLILVGSCLTVSAFIIDKDDTRIHGENGWYVPGVNDSFQWVGKEAAESYLKDTEYVEVRAISLTPVDFYLFTRLNPTKAKQITESAKSIKSSNFNPLHPTKFIIHGFTQSHTSNMNKKLRDVLLRKGDYNVIVVDWGRARSVDYVSSVMAVPKVGEKVARMINNLAGLHGMPLDNVSIIGHSLGAHVAGYAGKNIKAGQIHTIVGLDPALPLFNYDKPENRLNNTDAFYVETIQTNGGVFGFLLPIGKSAFYPNGGVSQPGCLTDVCSHERSIEYYAESIARDDFAALNCETLEDAVGKNCGDQYSSIRMGADINSHMVAGIFNVPVNKKSPFGTLA